MVAFLPLIIGAAGALAALQRERQYKPEGQESGTLGAILNIASGGLGGYAAGGGLDSLLQGGGAQEALGELGSSVSSPQNPVLSGLGGAGGAASALERPIQAANPVSGAGDALGGLGFQGQNPRTLQALNFLNQQQALSRRY